MDLRQSARYPFVSDASQFVREEKVTLEELLTHSAFASARLQGKKRVLDAIEKTGIDDNPLNTRDEQLQEILGYALARMLVSSVGDGFLIRRYALAEAKTFYERAQLESVEALMELAGQLGVQADVAEGALRLHFTEFLRLTTGIRSKEWKLVNTEVKHGMVALTRTRFARVLEQALHDRIEGELPLEVSDDILKALKNDIQELKHLAEVMKDRYKAENFGEVDVESFPPCIRRLIGMAQAGENISHTGRFALTSFLFSIGLSREDILAVFAASPDFDESKTKYQIDHITGEISGTTYTPPECSTMKSYGICFNPDPLCQIDWVKHPLVYYRARVRRKRSQQPSPVKPEEAKGTETSAERTP